MKKTIILLILTIVSVQAWSFTPKHIHLKKPVKLSDITDIANTEDTECDLCGCYMGLDPNFAKNQVGIRFSMIKFFTAGHAAVTNTEVDHPGHTTEASTEYYNDLELYARYYFTPKLRVMLSVPFGSNDIDGKKLNGVGDAKVIAQYQIYNTDITGKTNLWQRIFVGAGASLPTGVYNKSLTFGIVEPHFQPGTGSLDLILTALHLAKLEKVGVGWRNDFVYTVNGKNKNEYKFGNRFNWTSTLFYEVPVSSLTFLPHAGIYFESAKQDRSNGLPAEGSGGDIMFGTGGVDVYYGDFSLDLNYQYPIRQRFIGEQADNKFRIYTGLGYSF
ncbi:MAG: hypothetical protein SGI89_09645 [bacterium]|nr:hypothetical protein [bacterium]